MGWGCCVRGWGLFGDVGVAGPGVDVELLVVVGDGGVCGFEVLVAVAFEYFDFGGGVGDEADAVFVGELEGGSAFEDGVGLVHVASPLSAGAGGVVCFGCGGWCVQDRRGS